jgi:putative ABC transport system permease protein
MTVVAFRSTMASLRTARDEYYAEYRFAHVFAAVKRAPEAVADRIALIPGVAQVQTRVTLPVTLRVSGVRQLATGHIVSIPSERVTMPNDLRITLGRYVDPDRDDEVLVSELFARENALMPGDSLGAVVNGRWQTLRVAGIATSPEFIYEVGGGGLFVDNRLFAVLWMRREAVAAAGDFEGAFNNVALLLGGGASEAQVIVALDGLLDRYGGSGAIGRTDQLSNRVVSDEIAQLETISQLFPVFFLATAAFLLNVVLSRLISTQRDEIGALKAVGYDDRTVGAHYLAFALVAVALGAVFGVLGGDWLGRAYTGLYDDFFRFPSLEHRTRWSAALLGVAVSGGAGLLGALGAVRRAVRIPPADALRPPSPGRFRPLLLERAGLAAPPSVALRMILRNLERRPLRTAASTIGIAFACGLLVTGLFPLDSWSRILDLQFRRVQRDDLTVVFNSARPARAREELARFEGVRRVELLRTAPARIHRGHRARLTAVTGLDADAKLRRLVDTRGRVYPRPATGVVLSSTLAAILDARAGDSVEVEFLEQGGVWRRVPISGVVDELMGIGAYMDRRALNRLLGEADVATEAHLRVDRDAEEALSHALGELREVAGVASRASLLEYFDRTSRENVRISVSVIVFAAMIIAIGVVYNGVRITLSERGRELATLRVLGFTRGEAARMFLGEQGLLTAVGIPLGFLVGMGFSALLAVSFANERFRIPSVVDLSTYVFAAAVVIVTTLGVAIIGKRHVNRLDLIGTLKTGD